MRLMFTTTTTVAPTTTVKKKSMQLTTTTAAAATLTALALLLGGCGEKPPAAAPAAPAAAAPAAPAPTPVAAPAPAPPAATAENTLGKTVFGSTCSMCHGAGVAGSPKPGDKAEWAPRIAQGKDTLYKHAIEGFTGTKGMMPARGGNPKLTDDEVKAAVNFMIDKSI